MWFNGKEIGVNELEILECDYSCTESSTFPRSLISQVNPYFYHVFSPTHSEQIYY